MTRTLQIEESGDFHRQRTIPVIRLKGKWLERAGFPRGARVQITLVAPGNLTLSHVPLDAGIVPNPQSAIANPQSL